MLQAAVDSFGGFFLSFDPIPIFHVLTKGNHRQEKSKIEEQKYIIYMWTYVFAILLCIRRMITSDDDRQKVQTVLQKNGKEKETRPLLP